jgi:hypothetical protein
MDKYKHTCPTCGQHIEYTIDYCGRQIACPGCQTPIIFPDAPIPTATQKLRLQRDLAPRQKKSLLELPFIKALLEFSHWKVVGACLVPFLLIGGLLLGASYLRKNTSDEPAKIPQAVAAPISSDAWKKMTDLGQVEQAVQFRLQAVAAANRALLQARSAHDALHRTYEGATLDSGTYAIVMKQYADADKLVSMREQQLGAAQNAFNAAFEIYKQLGGQVDYSSQLPR